MNALDQPAANTTCFALVHSRDAVLITGPTGAVVLVTLQPDQTLSVKAVPVGELPPAELPAAAVRCVKVQRQREM